MSSSPKRDESNEVNDAIVLNIDKWNPNLDSTIINIRNMILEKYTGHLVQSQKLSTWNFVLNLILFLMNLLYSILIQFRDSATHINITLQITLPITTALSGFSAYTQTQKLIEKHNVAANRYKLIITTIDLYISVPNGDKKDVGKFINYLSNKDTEIDRSSPRLPVNIRKLKERNKEISNHTPVEVSTSSTGGTTIKQDTKLATYFINNHFKKDLDSIQTFSI